MPVDLRNIPCMEGVEDDLPAEAGVLPTAIVPGTDRQIAWCSPEMLGLPGDTELRAYVVNGHSMSRSGINHLDIAFFRTTTTAKHGEVVLASIDGHAPMLKYYIVENGMARLRAADSTISDFVPTERLEVKGVLVAVMRRVAPLSLGVHEPDHSLKMS